MANLCWICVECGGRQAEAGACQRCRTPAVLDGQLAHVRELMADIDLRRSLRREARQRMLSVALGIVPVFLLWLVPGFWATRLRLFALPMLFDQWLLMIGLALLAMRVLQRWPGAKRFPYLDDNQQLM